MVIVGVFGLCFGAALAQNFKVLVLLPWAIMAIALVMVIELVSGNYLVDALLASGEVACALQFGYLLGLSVKHFFVTDPKVVRTERGPTFPYDLQL